MNNSKAKFILKNFIKVLLLLFAVSVAAFALMTASQIDPLKANVGQAALGSMSQEQIAKLEEYWGVGQPPLQRYIAWFRDFVRGDMGISLLYRDRVFESFEEFQTAIIIDNKNILQLEKPLEILRAGIIDNEPMLKTPWGDKRLADKAVNK